MQLKIHQCGDDLAVILPGQLAAKLGWTSGDTVAAEIVGDGISMVRSMTAHDQPMTVARRGMDQYAEALKALAKR
jgi:antitoxin component of MazEF toxin-antitoxin module